MSGQDLMQELESKFAMLDAALGQLGKRGRTRAQAEQDYRVALAQKILIERDKGTPVTIISDICRGSAEIAAKKFARDCAETIMMRQKRQSTHTNYKYAYWKTK